MPDKFNLDNNTYYPAKDITVAPSSNGVDSGKIYTEYNGRRITLNIVDRNYVIAPIPVEDSDIGGYDVEKRDNKVYIYPGDAEINGFAVYTKNGIEYRLPTKEEIVTDDECYYKGYALLCLHTIFDAQSNLNGNEMVDSVWYCTGITIEYVSYKDYTEKQQEYLLLGGVDENGNIKPNKDKYTRIDAKYIFVKLEEDPETGAPPNQTTNLLDFINNFLHGYWVSKAGDNEYGELLFKSAPENYFEEGFDYETEDPLSSNKFGVKVSKHGGTIVVKPENEQSTNIVTQILSSILGFYQGLYKGDTVDLSDLDSYVNYNKSENYGKCLIIESNANKSADDKGIIKLSVAADNGSPSFVIEHNSQAHNGVDLGKVVYATNDTDNVGHGDDSDTVYKPTINYLLDKDNSIKTQNTTDISKYAKLDSLTATIEVSSDTDEPKVNIVSKSGIPTVQMNKVVNNDNLVGKLILSEANEQKTDSDMAWKNVIELSDNLKLVGTNGGSLYSTGFIYLGDAVNPTTVEVPDYANSNGMRKLKQYDVYSKGQIWSAVYNDVAEMFKLSEDLDCKSVTGKLLAVNSKDQQECVLADRHNTTIVGVVSENPAYCCGGDGLKHSVPVALAGRVNANYKGRRPKLGDYVGLDKKHPGYVTKCKHSSKYRCGKVVRVIDTSTVEIIVLL